MPAVQVVDTSPLHGTGIAADKVPDPVNAVSAQDVQRLFTFSVTDGLFQYIPGVTTSDVQGNPFFQDFRFRGFAATRLDLYRTLVRAGGAGLSVATLQEKHGIPASTLSHHLRRLIDTGLVTQER
ncbi:TonB-dependent receptor-like protein [Aquabacter spiritensis]|uniref:TonB-dependent receptor-like protein n=1 Tax=Aquabacter spiritensis TaxID=933073 RepID=A0A4R3LQE6_9HYPH|nr:TonB-dependent receptor-like protein [Aquabacter spiritensis]